MAGAGYITQEAAARAALEPLVVVQRALEAEAPHFVDFVDQTLLKLEASGEAATIYDAWFAPVPRAFRIQPD